MVTSVVIGAGQLGLAVTRELLRRGQHVRIVSRRGAVEVRPEVEVLAADVTNHGQAAGVGEGAGVIYHCAAPPYAQWVTKCVPIMEGIIVAAATGTKKIVYGDNLYAYGPVSGPLTEDLPYRATGPNGKVRAEGAAILMEAHRQGRVRAAIGRASDFYGPHVLQSTAGERIFVPSLRGKAAQVLGNPDAPHTYTFIDDFAGALVTLGERDDALGQIWHVPSAETVTTRHFVQMVFEEAGTPMRLSVGPEWAMSLIALFNPTMRAVKEQSYQRTGPWVVDHSKFARAFGAHPTPHREAIRQTLEWYRKHHSI